MSVLFWVVMPVVALVLGVFAVSNRGNVAVGLWPLPDVVEIPVYLIVLVTLFVGFFLGALSGWFGGHRRRRTARHDRRRIAALERELAATQARLDDGAASSPR
jgi:uncharacterized integral membrane protein